MSAYLIAQINVTNEDSYKEYLSKVTPIVEKYGGSYIVRAGRFKTVLGNWNFEYQPNSPCINSGDPTDTDPDGSIRDIGARWFGEDYSLPIEADPEGLDDLNCG